MGQKKDLLALFYIQIIYDIINSSYDEELSIYGVYKKEQKELKKEQYINT